LEEEDKEAEKHKDLGLSEDFEMGGFEGATKTHQQMMQKDIGKGEEEHSPDNQTEFEKSKGGNKNSSLNLNMKNLTSLSL